LVKNDWSWYVTGAAGAAIAPSQEKEPIACSGRLAAKNCRENSGFFPMRSRIVHEIVHEKKRAGVFLSRSVA
jgi:hypothetical protein